jgi:hypothetical protein
MKQGSAPNPAKGLRPLETCYFFEIFLTKILYEFFNFY